MTMTDTAYWNDDSLGALFNRMESVRGSANIALLTDAQYQDLETLCGEVRQLCARGCREDAAEVFRLVMSLVGGGPPTKG
jgi:hypothetical protein